jgi:hypothetical protein
MSGVGVVGGEDARTKPVGECEHQSGAGTHVASVTHAGQPARTHACGGVGKVADENQGRPLKAVHQQGQRARCVAGRGQQDQRPVAEEVVRKRDRPQVGSSTASNRTGRHRTPGTLMRSTRRPRAAGSGEERVAHSASATSTSAWGESGAISRSPPMWSVCRCDTTTARTSSIARPIPESWAASVSDSVMWKRPNLRYRKPSRRRERSSLGRSRPLGPARRRRAPTRPGWSMTYAWIGLAGCDHRREVSSHQ